MLEYEKKLIITQREYENIVTEYLPSKTIRQTNYYYDTENLSLNRAGITFRIREIEDVLTVTVKRHRINDKECSDEISYPVLEITHSINFEDKKLKLMGVLVSERSILLHNGNLECTVDKNIYLGQVDYELEIEFLPEKAIEAEILYRNITKKINKNDVDIPKTKSERFFEKYVELNRRGDFYLVNDENKKEISVLIKQLELSYSRMGVLIKQLKTIDPDIDKKNEEYDPDDYLLKEMYGYPNCELVNNYLNRDSVEDERRHFE